MKHFLFLIAVALALSFSMCKSQTQKSPDPPVEVAVSSMDQHAGIEYNVESMRSALDVRIDLCDSQSSLLTPPKTPGHQRPAEHAEIWAIPASDPIPRQKGPPE